MTAVAQALGLLFTAAGVLYMEHRLQRESQILFERGVERLESEITRRLSLPLFELAGLRGTFAANSIQSVTSEFGQEAFSAYVDSQSIGTKHPGLLNLGYVERVQRSELNANLASIRKNADPATSVGSNSSKDNLFAIKYIAPIDENHGAIGVDLEQDPIKLEGIERHFGLVKELSADAFM